VAGSPLQVANQVFQPDFAVSRRKGRFGGCWAESCSFHQPPSHQEQLAEHEQRKDMLTGQITAPSNIHDRSAAEIDLAQNRELLFIVPPTPPLDLNNHLVTYKLLFPDMTSLNTSISMSYRV